MTNLTFSGDSNFNSEENIKNNALKIFIFYCILSLVSFTLFNISGIRLFNSLNLTMTFDLAVDLPLDNLNDIVSTNFQKISIIISLTFSMLNFYLLFNIFTKKVFIKNHKEDLYLLSLTLIFIILIYFNNLDLFNIIISNK